MASVLDCLDNATRLGIVYNVFIGVIKVSEAYTQI